MDWLQRRGNGKQHNGTKQIPAVIFAEEQPYLQPIISRQPVKEVAIERTIRKDNTVMYQSNRYSVPFGSYDVHGRKVVLKVNDGDLTIIDPQTGEILSQHQISLASGKLIQRSSDRRNRSVGIPALMAQVKQSFTDQTAAQQFVSQIHEKYPRYTRDQLQVILRLRGDYPQEALDKALQFCLDNHLISATDFKATVETLPEYEAHMDRVRDELATIPLAEATQAKLKVVQPEVRSLGVYAKILKGAYHGTN
ncbi:Mu transposase domain-containing protein [Lentilactobacillus parafarraginis]|jgi:hypothetical protein|nr:hypothetical protein [Lentilactobacillus parafarraginis]